MAVQNNYRLSGLKSFNPKEKTYFIIHGWNGGGDKSADWIKKMMAALLKKVSLYWERRGEPQHYHVHFTIT